MSIQVQFHLSDHVRDCDTAVMLQAIQFIADDYGWTDAEISVALVSDDEIQIINQRHLQHNYATDVISFDLSESQSLLEGEIIASVETADREASQHGWTCDEEMLLYVIHGMLHIVGLRDKLPEDITAMRAAEKFYLEKVRS
jgi:probable rRNA maturation factor